MRRATPGWDFLADGKLKALKLPAILHGGATTIAVVAVHDASFPTLQAKAFVEKVALMFRPLVDDPALQLTTKLSAQALFAPALEQLLARANAQGKLAVVSRRVEEVKEIMHENIEAMLVQQERVELLEEKAQETSLAARQFKRATTAAKRMHLWNQAKMGLALGTAATVVTAAVVTPIIVAVAL
ncbi:hypothetical protein KFE25_007083 [Diacronema lutheri]|uniref:V-SNARE coiled-coil homology domain-containing protein n=1 Tax=Diacronema lutheri TaxID=2081491 RepID=A0A8J5XS92_DIALT|nr:hypothetical protein KFE25_007083 [Diacronema lutheri]